MRTMTAVLLSLAAIVASKAISAADPISSLDAASRARSAGYQYVSKTEAASGSWDIWASKDGIAYEVKINALDGRLMSAVPLEDND